MDTSTRAPTLSDVARLAQVSTATASRALNTPERVNEATRTRVENAVQNLGYRPHLSAQALASKRTNTMGAVIPTMDNAIFARGLQAFQETLSDAGVTTLVASSAYDPSAEQEQIENLVARGADGLLLIGVARDAAIYRFLQQRQVPYVIAWNTRADEPQHHYAGFNNLIAANQLAQTVIDAGHRQIAMIAGHSQGNDRAADRIHGVRQALTNAGLNGQNLALIEADYDIDQGAQALRQLLLHRQPRPTAVICGNDVLAAGAMHAAQELGLRVPEQLSIVGFDDIDLARVLSPKLTTVHVPHRRMGAAAATMLLELRAGKQVESISFDVELVIRGSLSAPN